MANNAKFITIRVRDGVLPPKSKGHVLLYDGASDSYYFATLDDLFAEADRKVDEIRADKARIEEDCLAFKDSVDADFRAFKSEMIGKYNDLLASFKETSEALILMVEKSKENSI